MIHIMISVSGFQKKQKIFISAKKMEIFIFFHSLTIEFKYVLLTFKILIINLLDFRDENKHESENYEKRYRSFKNRW